MMSLSFLRRIKATVIYNLVILPKKIYFHVTVNDAKLYNKKLSIKYITSVGYEDGKDIVLTADENTYAFEYPSTPSKNYTIEFKLLDDNNSVLTSQKITVK